MYKILNSVATLSLTRAIERMAVRKITKKTAVISQISTDIKGFKRNDRKDFNGQNKDQWFFISLKWISYSDYHKYFVLLNLWIWLTFVWFR